MDTSEPTDLPILGLQFIAFPIIVYLGAHHLADGVCAFGVTLAVSAVLAAMSGRARRAGAHA